MCHCPTLFLQFGRGWWAVAVVRLGLAIVANRRFQAFIAFGTPPCSTQIGRENNTWISTLGIPSRFCASTEIGRLGEE